MPLDEAVKGFMADPAACHASGQWRDKIGYWLDRLVEGLGGTRNIQDIEPSDIIAHIEKYKAAKTNKKKVATYLCKFLKWGTAGMFHSASVKEWVEELPAEDEQWDWLKPKEGKRLIASLRKLHGGYWADAGSLQYGMGWRPEELPLLQTTNVKDGAIRLVPIHDGKTMVRRLKTKSRTVNIPKMAKSAVKRRLAGGGFLLFPMPPELPWTYGKHRTAFEHERQLWPSADDGGWSGAFLARLREAATAAGIDSTRIDSRMLRRTCARELILAHGFERAAAVLGDTVQTLRKHYADLEAEDVSTER
jgi:hypothetical protein